MLKRLGCYVAILAFGLIFMTGTALAISLSINPASQNVLLGDSFNIGINISDLGDSIAPSLGTFDLDLTFDSSILSFNNVSYGDPILGDQLDIIGLGGWILTTPGTGTVNLFELSLDDEADLNDFQASSFTLATLTFNTLGIGTSPFELAINSLGDAAGDPLYADVSGGSVTVVASSNPIPEPGTIFLLITGLLGVVGIKGRKTFE